MRVGWVAGTTMVLIGGCMNGSASFEVLPSQTDTPPNSYQEPPRALDEAPPSVDDDPPTLDGDPIPSKPCRELCQEMVLGGCNGDRCIADCMTRLVNEPCAESLNALTLCMARAGYFACSQKRSTGQQAYDAVPACPDEVATHAACVDYAFECTCTCACSDCQIGRDRMALPPAAHSRWCAAFEHVLCADCDVLCGEYCDERNCGPATTAPSRLAECQRDYDDFFGG